MKKVIERVRAGLTRLSNWPQRTRLLFARLRRINLERVKAGLIATHQPAKTLLLWTAVVCVVVLTFYGIKIANSISHSAEAQAANYERGSGELVGAVQDIRKMIQRYDGQIALALDNGVQASASLKRIAGNSEPQVKSILRNLDWTTLQSGSLIADARNNTIPLVNKNLSTLNDTQLKLGQTVDVTREGLKKVIADLAASGENVRILTSSEDLQAMPADIRAFIQSLNRTGAKVELVADDMHVIGLEIGGVAGNLNKISADAQKKSHELLYPPPSPWYQRYLLGPIRQFGGAMYLVLKIANGL